MSEWHRVTDYSVDKDEKEVDFLVRTTDFGNVYATVSFEIIKEIAKMIDANE